ncbi:Molybdopterin cofactor biosynthesis C domain-containing protein [Xylogone sp. PMI_703]|nr:Molybdopterin cofactor biosynthesis C domain-containing protein [Xylogone sp. PMI_703]
MAPVDKRSRPVQYHPPPIINPSHPPYSRTVPLHLLNATTSIHTASLRHYTTKPNPPPTQTTEEEQRDQRPESGPSLTHLNQSGEAHMVSISSKTPTKRTAVAVCRVYFSNATALPLIKDNRAKKGDVLGVARIAGIMAAKRTPELIPLCHPIAITHVSVDLDVQDSVSSSSVEDGFGWVDISATVSCDGKTGVEMEALAAASTAALTVYDMCKAVDKGMRIEGLRVTRKEGGKSGTYIEGQKQ